MERREKKILEKEEGEKRERVVEMGRGRQVEWTPGDKSLATTLSGTNALKSLPSLERCKCKTLRTYTYSMVTVSWFKYRIWHLN